MQVLCLMNTINIRPIYADTDSGGVVYYATYLAWMEKGRTELIRDLGFSVKTLQSNGLLFAVKSVNLQYNYPTFYDDNLEVQTTITESKGAKVYFYQQIFNLDTQQKAVYGDILLVALNSKTFKPTRIPDELSKALIIS